MVKKHSWIVPLFLLLLFISACSTTTLLEKKFLGKRLNLNQLRKLNDSGHHFWKHKHLDIDYDYSIDSESKTITFDGTIKYNISIDESVYRSEMILQNIKRCEFRVLFADISRNVVAVQVFNIYPDTPIYDPAPFKKTVPYYDSYYYVSFGYYLYSSEGE